MSFPLLPLYSPTHMLCGSPRQFYALNAHCSGRNLLKKFLAYVFFTCFFDQKSILKILKRMFSSDTAVARCLSHLTSWEWHPQELQTTKWGSLQWELSRSICRKSWVRWGCLEHCCLLCLKPFAWRTSKAGQVSSCCGSGRQNFTLGLPNLELKHPPAS